MKEGTKAKLNQLGKLIFYNGTPVAFDYLVNKSLSGNTYRGFHRLDKSGEGSADVFRNFLRKNDSIFFEKLKEINNQEEYHIFLNALADDLRQKLSNILPKQLNSYNKLRKPLDIYFEHLISMDERYSKYRNRLIPFLNLPLDSWMFKDRFVFSDEELKLLRIKRSFTFTNIESEQHYIEIQDFLRKKAEKEGLDELIYFDLLWGKRHEKTGLNLFELNPQKRQKKKPKQKLYTERIPKINNTMKELFEIRKIIEDTIVAYGDTVEFMMRNEAGTYVAKPKGSNRNIITAWFNSKSVRIAFEGETKEKAALVSTMDEFKMLNFSKRFKEGYNALNN